MNSDGKFKPGVIGNPKGRPKGSKNLFNKAAKDAIKRAFSIEIRSLKKDFAKMSPKDKWNIMLGLMKYIMPEQSEVKNKMSGEMKYEISYTDELKEDFTGDEFKVGEWPN
jgi:hypothetical protein